MIDSIINRCYQILDQKKTADVITVATTSKCIRVCMRVDRKQIEFHDVNYNTITKDEFMGILDISKKITFYEDVFAVPHED